MYTPGSNEYASVVSRAIDRCVERNGGVPQSTERDPIAEAMGIDLTASEPAPVCRTGA